MSVPSVGDCNNYDLRNFGNGRGRIVISILIFVIFMLLILIYLFLKNHVHLSSRFMGV